VVGRCADGRWRAHVVEEAGVHAVVLDASAVRRAVGVDVALHGLASDEGIADKSCVQVKLEWIKYESEKFNHFFAK
jgi:hypothetical protein